MAEVLFAATRTRDLTVKRDLNEAHGVRWYLIGDPDEGRSSLLRLGTTGRYEALPAAGPQEIALCPTCTLAIDIHGL